MALAVKFSFEAYELVQKSFEAIVQIISVFKNFLFEQLAYLLEIIVDVKDQAELERCSRGHLGLTSLLKVYPRLLRRQKHSQLKLNQTD